MVIVAIATFRRPDTLRVLLRALQEQQLPADVRVEVVVIDNDASGSARNAVREEMDRAIYTVEATPGIAAARNRSVEEAAKFDPWAIAFTDDDCVPRPNWLISLIGIADRYGADVATGPVVYSLPDDTEPFVRASRLFARLEHDEGARVSDVATNNALVLGAKLIGPSAPRFSSAFSLTGGSDKELFERLARSGAVIIWSNVPLVEEPVPPQRATSHWIDQRNMRNGQLDARLRLQFHDASILRVMLTGLLRISLGALRFTPGPWPRVRWFGRNNFYYGVGVARALLKAHHEEYGRDQDSAA